jgi:cytoskeletal protein RodZ
VDIGETLATARQQAGLTVTQVSERTRIRETVIRAIEHNDFSTCGGNFYARGHIRGIARVVGTDSEPLVRAYDDAHGGAPQAISAVAAFEPETPMRFKERRSPNWTAAMAVALALVMVYVIVKVVSSASSSPGKLTSKASRTMPAVSSTPAPPSPQRNAASAPAAPLPKDVVLQVTAVRSSWINVQDDQGHQLFSGLIYSGDTKRWTDAKKLKILIGNAGGVKLNVNGRDMGAPGGDGQVIRLTFVPGNPAGV